MQQRSGDGVERRTVRDIGTGIAEDRDHTVGDGPAFAGQVVAEAVGGLHEGRQHDRLVGKLHCAEHLPRDKGTYQTGKMGEENSKTFYFLR